MRRGIDRVNRFLLGLLGLLLLAASVAGLLTSFGLFGRRAATRAVFAGAVPRFVGRNGVWVWIIIGLISVLVALVALRWLLAQLSTPKVRDLDLEPDRAAGSTTLAASAVTSAFCDEVSGYRGVAGTRAQMTTDPRYPELRATVVLDERADLALVRERLETQALARVRQAMDDPELPAYVDLKVEAGRGSRAA